MKVTGNRRTEPMAHQVARVPLPVEYGSKGEAIPRQRYRVITAVGSASAYTLAIVRSLIREGLA